MTDDVRSARTASIWVGLIAPLALLGLAAAVIAAWLPQLPDPIATHWGTDGVDGFSAKWTYIPVTLGIGGGVVLLIALLALFADRLPPRSHTSSTSTRAMGRLLAAVNLGTATLISLIGVAGAAMQRGLTDAADSPDIGGWIGVGLAAALVLGAAGWFVQPKPPAGVAGHAEPAGSMPLAANERAAWFGTATMARAGVILLIVALAVLVTMTVFYIARGIDVWWILAIVTVVMVLAIATMVVFRVRIDAQGLRARSVLGWPTNRVSLDRIAKVEVVQIDPLREFGGWGWRFGVDGRRGIVLRAGEALQVTQTNGRVFVVTVDGASDAATDLEALRAHAV